VNLFSQGRFKADTNRYETAGDFGLPPSPAAPNAFPAYPREKQRKRSADRGRGERRGSEAREIKGWGFGRNRYERNRILEQIGRVPNDPPPSTLDGGSTGCCKPPEPPPDLKGAARLTRSGGFFFLQHIGSNISNKT